MREPIVSSKTRSPIEKRNYKGRSAIIEDCCEFVNRPTVVYDEEQSRVTVV